VQSYRNLPSTLSSANEKLLDILNCPRLRDWANDKADRWMIPPTHVGQNRTLCVGLTKLLANGNVVKLYDQYKIIQKISYIVVGKRVRSTSFVWRHSLSLFLLYTNLYDDFPMNCMT
jgi:hypothetical protein